jgi:hypothetical protein
VPGGFGVEPADVWDRAGRPAGALRVHLNQPLGDLTFATGTVMNASLEEAAFDPTGHILRARVWVASRPAQFGGEAVVEHDLAKDRIPDDWTRWCGSSPRQAVVTPAQNILIVNRASDPRPLANQECE